MDTTLAAPAAELEPAAWRKFESWFFRECNEGTRRHLYAMFDMPLDEIRNHGHERHVLSRIRRKLQSSDQLQSLIEENATLAAGSCDVPGGKIGDEHGHFYCALKAENERLREVAIDIAASLAAAISLLERGGKVAKKAAPSDKMFDQMMLDYKASLDRARAALAGEKQ